MARQPGEPDWVAEVPNLKEPPSIFSLTNFTKWQVPPNHAPEGPPNDQTKKFELIMDSCANKAIGGAFMGMAMGGAMGAIFGIMPGAGGAVDYEAAADDAKRAKGIRQKAYYYLGETGGRSRAMAKTFGKFSLAYAGSECVIEKARGKHDLLNAVSGGCITGIVMGARGGPWGMAGGCVGIGAFSGAIDFYMEGMTLDELKELSIQ